MVLKWQDTLEQKKQNIHTRDCKVGIRRQNSMALHGQILAKQILCRAANGLDILVNITSNIGEHYLPETWETMKKIKIRSLPRRQTSTPWEPVTRSDKQTGRGRSFVVWRSFLAN